MDAYNILNSTLDSRNRFYYCLPDFHGEAFVSTIKTRWNDSRNECEIFVTTYKRATKKIVLNEINTIYYL